MMAYPCLSYITGNVSQVTIGSFGIRLSGGQRARVALARAAYMEARRVEMVGGSWKE